MNSRPVRVALITTDSRDHFRQFDRTDPYFGTAPQALLEGLAERQNLEVHVISCLHREMTSSSKLAENIFYHGLPVGPLGWMKSGYLGCIRAVRTKLRQIRPDIVHGQGTEKDCSMDAVFSGYPNVLTIHGNMQEIKRLHGHGTCSFYGIAAALEKACLRRTDGVVCITRYTRELVQPFASKTWLLPNAVDKSFFNVKKTIPKGPKRILCVGLICPRKNQNALIRACEGLDPERKGFELVFAGQVSPDSEYGREFLALAGRHAWCKHAGFLDRGSLRSAFAESHALILPSLEDNCPMVVLEALASGVPVAASRVGGLPDLIRSGENGHLFDPGSSEDMAGAIGLLLGEGVEAWIEQGKRDSLASYHPDTIAEKHEAIYREVLQARRGGPEQSNP